MTDAETKCTGGIPRCDCPDCQAIAAECDRKFATAMADALEKRGGELRSPTMVDRQTNVTHYQDVDEDECPVFSYLRKRPPWWFNTLDQPCNCVAPIELTDQHTGYSDCAYERYRCTKCGKTWYGYFEG